MAIVASPTSLTFSGAVHNVPSAPQTVTLTPDVTTDSIFGIRFVGAGPSGTSNGAVFSSTETYDTSPAAGGQYSQFGNSAVIGALPNATGSIPVVFTGTAVASFTANLEVHYNGNGGAAVLLVPLTGTCSS